MSCGLGVSEPGRSRFALRLRVDGFLGGRSQRDAGGLDRLAQGLHLLFCLQRLSASFAGRVECGCSLRHLLPGGRQRVRTVGAFPNALVDGGLLDSMFTLLDLKSAYRASQTVETNAKHVHLQQRLKVILGLGRLGVKRPSQPPLLHEHT